MQAVESTSRTSVAAARAERDALNRARAGEIRRVTLWGMGFNLLLAAAKGSVGALASSQALIADAVHSISDTVTDLAVVVGARYWSAPADADHPHGHGRIETLVTLLIGMMLAGVGVMLAYRALMTLHQYHRTMPGWSALAVACISVAGKELLYQWTVRVAKRLRSTAMIANAWHHRSDALSSLPVAVAVLGTHLYPSWGFLDHIAAVLVSALVLQAAWTIVWPALQQLLDAGARSDEREAILGLARSVDGVRGVHALRTRHIGPGLQVDIHVLVAPELTVRQGHNISGAVKERLLLDGPDVVDVLIHVEPCEDDGAEAQDGA